MKIELPPAELMPSIETIHLMLVLSNGLKKKFSAAVMEASGLTLPEKEVLAKIYMSEGQINMSDVSKTLMFTDGGTTKIIKRLNERGYITRQQSEDDRRVTLLNITDIGVEKLNKAFRAMDAIAYPLMKETYSDDELDTLYQLLSKIKL